MAHAGLPTLPRDREYSGAPFGRPFDHLLQTRQPDLASGTTVLGQDSIYANQMLVGMYFYCGYVWGIYNNYNQVTADFPGKHYIGISIAVSPTDCYDIEPGGGLVSSAAPFFNQSPHPNLVKPCFYASAGDVQTIINTLASAGISRSQYLIFSAHWIGRHICSPSACGYPQADLTQYGSSGAYDSDIATTGVFRGVNIFPLVQGDSDGPGATSGTIHTLQANINKWAAVFGLAAVLTVDGDYGPATAAAVTLAEHFFNDTGAAGACSQTLFNYLAGALYLNPPTGAAARNLAYDSAALSWHAPAGATPDHYQVYLYEFTATAANLVPGYGPKDGVTGTSLTLTGLTPQTSYIAHVVSAGPGNTLIEPNAYSEAVFMTPAQLPPANQTGTVHSYTTGGNAALSSSDGGHTWVYGGPVPAGAIMWQVGKLHSDQTNAYAWVATSDGGGTWHHCGMFTGA